MKTIFILFNIVAFFNANSIFAQNNDIKNPFMSLHQNEKPDEKFKPTIIREIKTTPAYTIYNNDFFTTQVNVDINGNNIVGDAANEPSIAIDPTNPNRIVIGWRQFDDIGSSWREAGYGYSTNGGNTWVFPGVIQPGIFRSDPVLNCDASGTFYYTSVTTTNPYGYACDVFKTIGNGFEWDEGTFAQGGDKPWMIIDRTNGIGEGNLYSSWVNANSLCSLESFTRSVDKGVSYENCIKVVEKPGWGTMAVGPDGELYIVGSHHPEGLIVVKSTTAKNPANSVTWDFYSLVFLDGVLAIGLEINPMGLLGQAYIDVDHSSGPGNGNVYVLASVTRISNRDPADVMFSKSTDGGLSWSYPPTRINDNIDTTSYQWFGTMSVAPNGRIDAVWLDTRDSNTVPIKSALYYSYSTNQGTSWSANERISDYFDSRLGWPNQQKMGDYFHMISDNNAVHLAWCNTFGGEQNVYYTRIIAVSGINEFKKNNFLSLSCFPNPVSSQATISYALPNKSDVKIVISDILGNEIKTIYNASESAGQHKIMLETALISGGVYMVSIAACGTVESYRMVIVK